MKHGRKQNNVIIADDDLFIRKVLSSALEGLATIVPVADGGEVEAAYREHTPDVVFLDLHLPNATGLELIPRLLAIEPDAYIIMLSADSSGENVKEAIARGAKGFLAKPCDKTRVVKAFNECPTVRYLD